MAFLFSIHTKQSQGKCSLIVIYSVCYVCLGKWCYFGEIPWMRVGTFFLKISYLKTNKFEKFVVHWFYWSAQTIRVVSQIYREQNNRGDVSQSENTDVTRTDKTDWTIPILLSLLFVVVIWNGKGKYLWMKLLLAFSLNWNFFLRNRKKEKETAFWLSMLAFPDSLKTATFISICLIFATYIISNSSLFWRGK